MLRSRSPRGPQIGYFLLNNPFLVIAIISGAVFGLKTLGMLAEPQASRLWMILGYGFHYMANLLARHLPNLPDLLDIAMVMTLGLIPYLLADMLWRWVRPGT